MAAILTLLWGMPTILRHGLHLLSSLQRAMRLHFSVAFDIGGGDRVKSANSTHTKTSDQMATLTGVGGIYRSTAASASSKARFNTPFGSAVADTIFYVRNTCSHTILNNVE